MIKLLALDLDGTTLAPDGRISEKDREAILRAEDNGVLVTIATGRRFRDAKPVGSDLGLNAPMITHNGALIKYAHDHMVVEQHILPTETAQDVVDIGRSFDGDPLVSVDPDGIGRLLYDRVSDHNLPLKKYLRWAETLHGERPGRDGVDRVDDLVRSIEGESVVHISFSGTCEMMEELGGHIQASLNERVHVLSTVYPKLDFTLIDILPPGASKGIAVHSVAEKNNITRDETMAIGDNHNDIAMLEYAGIGVAMGNAEPQLLERAEFYTTLTNAESGVAAAIERFIFKQ